MLASLLVFLAQGRGTQEPPDEGVGIGLIILGIVIAIAVATLIFFVFTRISKRDQTGPDREPHERGHYGA